MCDAIASGMWSGSGEAATRSLNKKHTHNNTCTRFRGAAHCTPYKEKYTDTGGCANTEHQHRPIHNYVTNLTLGLTCPNRTPLLKLIDRIKPQPDRHTSRSRLLFSFAAASASISCSLCFI